MEGGTAMKRARDWREVLSHSSQWDPSSSNRRECLYIAVIMGCNDFVNGGNKERNGSLAPCCHLSFLSCVSFALLFFSRDEDEGGGQRPPTSPPLCLTTGVSRVPLLYLHRSLVNRQDHLGSLMATPQPHNH